jgi:hypothetical protein
MKYIYFPSTAPYEAVILCREPTDKEVDTLDEEYELFKVGDIIEYYDGEWD